ncbi:MAG: GHMP kinase [Deltaproteobacteria bacterium]|nr:GHMP kinase [Deltaproteobacteria bacterium]
MIIAQTPYRISFAGGGTDLPAFYREEPGAVLSTAIDRHMYVTVGSRFDDTIRVAYSKTEIVDSPKELQHTIVREALATVGLDRSLEITTIGDVPAGTGMGSSSSLTVALLTALYAYRGKIASPEILASEACNIEIDRLQSPIGRQDQYIAAYGGLQYIRFNPDDSVQVEPVPCAASTLAQLEERLLLFYTGETRDANAILKKQSVATEKKLETLCRMRDLAGAMREALAGHGGADLEGFGDLLHEGWELKRSIVSSISTSLVDDWYAKARAAGARGGKLLGAGGGGFLLIFADPDRHEAIRSALGKPRELPVGLDPLGSRIIFIGKRA